MSQEMANENPKPKTSKSALLGLIGLGFLLVIVGILYSPREETTADPLIGMEAPDFDYEIEAGKVQRLSALKGKVVLVNFWAYWCEPCLKEIPSLRQLETHLAGKDFVLLMMHVGDEKEEALRVPNLPAMLSFSVPPSTLASYGVVALPHSFLIDKQGVIRAEFKGDHNWMSPEILEQIQEPLG